MNQAPSGWSFRIGRIFLRALATLFVLFIVLVVSINVGLEVVMGIYEAAFHLALGFVFFLKGEASALLADRGAWLALFFLPVLAFCSARVLGKRLASRCSEPCSSRHFRALALVMLALLAAPLVIGGSLRALKGLAGDPVFADANGVEGYENMLVAAELQKALQQASRHQKQFPDSLRNIQAELNKDWIAAMYRDPYAKEPPELPIYLGAGAPTSLDPSFPLLISARHRSGGGKWRWTVFTLAGEEHDIEESETAIWVQRALDARRARSFP
jgi:hypothetical protein